MQHRDFCYSPLRIIFRALPIGDVFGAEKQLLTAVEDRKGKDF